MSGDQEEQHDKDLNPNCNIDQGEGPDLNVIENGNHREGCDYEQAILERIPEADYGEEYRQDRYDDRKGHEANLFLMDEMNSVSTNEAYNIRNWSKGTLNRVNP